LCELDGIYEVKVKITSGLSKAKQSVPLQKLPLEDCSLLRFEATLNDGGEYYIGYMEVWNVQ